MWDNERSRGTKEEAVVGGIIDRIWDGLDFV